MEKKALYGVAGKLEKQGFLGKTTRFGNIFSMVTASDKAKRKRILENQGLQNIVTG